MKHCVQRLINPQRAKVRDSKNKWLATMTDGAYTVTLSGPRRTFAEPTAAHAVTPAIWVGTLSAPFDGRLDKGWLKYALEANKRDIPDVLEIAMQYVKGPRRSLRGVCRSPATHATDL